MSAGTGPAAAPAARCTARRNAGSSAEGAEGGRARGGWGMAVRGSEGVAAGIS